MTHNVALITGSAKRLGAAIATQVHTLGYQVAIHFRQTADSAQQLCHQFNQIRPNSAIFIAANLMDEAHLQPLVDRVVAHWGQLDLLVNNAAAFFPTHLGHTTGHDWDTLFHTNVKAPYFLAQYAIPHLSKRNGNIINIIDIHAEQPLKNFSLYCMSKAALQAMTRSLAKELGPEIRVNGIACNAALLIQ